MVYTDAHLDSPTLHKRGRTVIISFPSIFLGLRHDYHVRWSFSRNIDTKSPGAQWVAVIFWISHWIWYHKVLPDKRAWRVGRRDCEGFGRAVWELQQAYITSDWPMYIRTDIFSPIPSPCASTALIRLLYHLRNPKHLSLEVYQLCVFDCQTITSQASVHIR